MIASINEQFIPVWINTRDQPYPGIPALKELAHELGTDENGRIVDTVPYYFHARTFIVSPDMSRLLNPVVAGRSLTIIRPEPYLRMLVGALALRPTAP